MEREVGGGIGRGTTCKLKAVSFQCMTKSTANLKKKKNNFLTHLPGYHGSKQSGITVGDEVLLAT